MKSCRLSQEEMNFLLDKQHAAQKLNASPTTNAKPGKGSYNTQAKAISTTGLARGMRKAPKRGR